MKRRLIVATLFCGLLPCAVHGEVSKFYDNPDGYYDTTGDHRDLNDKMQNGAQPAPGLDPKVVNDTLTDQYKNAPPRQSGESLESYQIRIARVPLKLVPDIRPEVVDPNATKPEPGKIGLDEKLTEARRMADAGATAASATAILLLGAAISDQIGAMTMAMGGGGSMPAGSGSGGASSAGEFQAAADAVWQEYANMWGVYAMWKDKSAFYASGKKQITHDYERGNKQAQVTPGPQTAPPVQSTPPQGGSGRASVVTEDSAKPGDTKLSGTVNLPDSARAALEAKGIDVDDFLSRALSGEFKSGADVRAFLGAPSVTPTAEEAERGQKLAEAQLDQAGYTPPDGPGGGSSQGRIVAFDGLQKTTGKDPLSRALGVLSPGASVPGAGLLAKRRGQALRAQSGVGSPLPELPKTRPELQAVLKKLLREREALTEAAAPAYYGLLAQGIQSSVHGQNLFQIAHRNYRSFGKWRGPKKGHRRFAMIAD